MKSIGNLSFLLYSIGDSDANTCQRRCDMQLCYVDSSVVCVDEYSQGMTSSQTNPITLYPPLLLSKRFVLDKPMAVASYIFFLWRCVDSDVSPRDAKQQGSKRKFEKKLNNNFFV